MTRFTEATRPKGKRAQGPERRTVRQLLADANARSAERKRLEAERARAERERRQRKQAEERVRHLNALASRESETWREVETLIDTKRPKDYDRAVELLIDLRELAERSGRKESAENRIRELRAKHRNKPAFLQRLDKKKLGG